MLSLKSSPFLTVKTFLSFSALAHAIAAWIAVGLPRMAIADPVTASAADAFVDSIGVNIHLHYNDTIYGDFQKVKGGLQNLGVRHVRDGLVDTGWQPYLDGHNELAAAGIRCTFIVSLPLDKLAPVAQKLTASIEAFEGPNEVNLNQWTVEDAKAYQRDLWNTVKASAFAATPVVALSVTDFDWAKKLGDLSEWCDYGNVHPYPGGWEPENGASFMRADLPSGIESARASSGSKPIMITETGYHNATSEGGGHVPVSVHAAGIYLPRLFLNNYRHKIVRTFWYEMMNSGASTSDPEANFGLYLNDGITLKPGGRAMKQMIGLLADPGNAFKTGSLDFQLSEPKAQSVLLQKRNGEFWLALWLKSNLWDESRAYGKKEEVDPPDSACKVTLNGAFKAVTIHEQLDAETPSSRSASDPGNVDLTLCERVMFLQIVPAKN